MFLPETTEVFGDMIMDRFTQVGVVSTYLEFLDLPLQLGNEVLFFLELAVYTVDFHVLPREREKGAI